MLKIDVAEVADVAVCHVAGDLDGTSVSRFRQAFAGCLGRPGLVIDLSELLFVDGAGVTALVGGIRRARELSADVAIACNRRPLRKVLEQIGLNLIVNVSDRTENALAEVRSISATRRPSA